MRISSLGSSSGDRVAGCRERPAASLCPIRNPQSAIEELGSFCTIRGRIGFVPHNRLFVAWASSPDFFRIGFVSHDSLPARAGPSRLGLFCTIGTRRTATGSRKLGSFPRNRLADRFTITSFRSTTCRRIGFVSHDSPADAGWPSANWVRFARLSPDTSQPSPRLALFVHRSFNRLLTTGYRLLALFRTNPHHRDTEDTEPELVGPPPPGVFRIR